ncbi:PhzF family phenazine biosynthesis protein [Propionicimonas sp.]|uniref:PhzF family phenazine biosynthesis protein n=1 Tax=Propionicimonas sp. TaxID=1955623 RepID=UPI0017E703B2|nr:PhzF family phenazine biosynthesis protein [Propionicimonas sp.]MBU3975776.1 PhzF family phenazine biosynthesis protein [Actinomycetota bacterium]MBA3022234.1 PhzF family phenazine biosynthesis protein [Propionicimonas sp.]MBU3987666.1 PhzF family phenazine biosynthesis protein [Actinomycetota bacterium]MBU4007700.1 PhzF family phenazine biosynthesis protein [Actinomycetota bacterium]MBU4065334.1 PhzF family phenazine biosynthesis protein [Actinomycetota bacterium]
MARRFTQVDVFGDGGITGNPLAVVHNADDLTDEQMQAFASWTNLSETTFLLRPTEARADYRVRIFTPSGELPFAGHPTLGTAHVWLASGGRPSSTACIVQECGIGLVELRGQDGRLAFAAPPRLRSEKLGRTEVARIARAIGIPAKEWVAHAWGDNGAPWMMVQLADAEAVRRVEVNRGKLGASDFVGLIGLEADGGRYAYEVRAVFTEGEDPVTGSLNAAAAQWMRERKLVPASYLVTQGSAIGRHGEISVYDDGERIWISGKVRKVISGELSYPTA